MWDGFIQSRESKAAATASQAAVSAAKNAYDKAYLKPSVTMQAQFNTPAKVKDFGAKTTVTFVEYQRPTEPVSFE